MNAMANMINETKILNAYVRARDRVQTPKKSCVRVRPSLRLGLKIQNLH